MPMPNSTIRRYMRHGTLPQLCVFEAVARLGSYTRAAEELHMAQPTVSVQVRKLTDTIGFPLLEQVGKTVRPTPVGKELLASCGELFDAFVRFEQKISELRGLQTGSLDIAVTSGAKSFGSRMVVEFAQRYPDVKVRMHVAQRQGLLERIAANVDDLYLMWDPPKGNEVVRMRLLANPLVVVAQRDHPLADRRSIPFEDFAKEPLLLREQGSESRAVTERAFAEHGRSPSIRMELGSSEAILEALGAGMGVSIMSRHLIAGAAGASLVELDVQGFPIESEWFLVYPVGKQVSFIAQAFLALVRAQLHEDDAPAPVMASDARG